MSLAGLLSQHYRRQEPWERGTFMTQPETRTLEVPGVVLHYDVRHNDTSPYPALLLAGSPMGATGFGTLAGHFTDRTVVTYDPRGAERSKRTDGALRTTTEEQADDLHRLILALGGGPVDVFGSSGGAVNALALVAGHPEQVRTLVAHEPPSVEVLKDHEEAMAACEAIHETYLREGFADHPAPNPADFGLPTEDDGRRDDALLGLNMISTPGYQHDFDALRAARTRIVIGVGAESATMIAGRAATAVAGRLGTAPVTFPGGHDGFVGGEYGRTGQPDAFAAILREVLTA
jgi:pimeloyl-ACP methyl ester carboxylesterase